MDEDLDLTTIDSYGKPSLISPCLVSFEYGSLDKDEASKLNCNMYVNKKGRRARTLIVSKGNQFYKGKLSDDSLCQTLLLIRNKRTKKARIVSAFSCMLENSLKSRSHSRTTINSDTDTMTNINNLNQIFGSKKQKRMSDLGMRLKVNATVLQDEVKNMIADISVDKKELTDIKVPADEAVIQLLPQCDREATTVEDVYKVGDLLNENELSTLESAVTSLKEEPEKMSPFLKVHFNMLNSESNPDNTKLLIYADSLLKFVNMGAVEIKNKNAIRSICPYSRVVAAKILNEFTVMTGNTRNRPVSYKDKAVCYVMILTLLACNFAMNMDQLCSTIKGYHLKKLMQLSKIVGAVPVIDPTLKQKLHVLKVPLPKLPSVYHKNKKN